MVPLAEGQFPLLFGWVFHKARENKHLKIGKSDCKTRKISKRTQGAGVPETTFNSVLMTQFHVVGLPFKLTTWKKQLNTSIQSNI